MIKCYNDKKQKKKNQKRKKGEDEMTRLTEQEFLSRLMEKYQSETRMLEQTQLRDERTIGKLNTCKYIVKDLKQHLRVSKG